MTRLTPNPNSAILKQAIVVGAAVNFASQRDYALVSLT